MNFLAMLALSTLGWLAVFATVWRVRVARRDRGMMSAAEFRRKWSG